MSEIDWLQTIKNLEKAYGTQKALAKNLDINPRTIRGWKEFEKKGSGKRRRNIRNSKYYDKLYNRAYYRNIIVYEEKPGKGLQRFIVSTAYMNQKKTTIYFTIDTKKSKPRYKFDESDKEDAKIQHKHWTHIFDQITPSKLVREFRQETEFDEYRKIDKLESERLGVLGLKENDYFIVYDLEKQRIQGHKLFDEKFVKEELLDALNKLQEKGTVEQELVNELKEIAL